MAVKCNSLLQDIAVVNEHDSTKLEEWLMDIEWQQTPQVKAELSSLR